eukprot:scaffold17993_cov52-Phaeocystis_antarctica.AAC.2
MWEKLSASWSTITWRSRHRGLQPLAHKVQTLAQRVADPGTEGCSHWHRGLQTLAHKVAATGTEGCRPRHIRLRCGTITSLPLTCRVAPCSEKRTAPHGQKVHLLRVRARARARVRARRRCTYQASHQAYRGALGDMHEMARQPTPHVHRTVWLGLGLGLGLGLEGAPHGQCAWGRSL